MDPMKKFLSLALALVMLLGLLPLSAMAAVSYTHLTLPTKA